MTAQGDPVGGNRTRFYVLLAVLAAVVLVFAAGLGRMASTKRMQFVPGMGAIAPQTSEPLGAEVLVSQEMSAKGRAGMRAGGGMRGGGGGAYAPADEAPGGGFEVSQVAQAAPPPSATRMLIRTGSLRLRVDDVVKAHEEVARIARAAKGYVASTSLNSEQGPTYAVMTLRLPAEGLDSVIDRVSALGKVLSKEISTDEVTEEYVDLSARKRNLGREEERLLELLKRAGKISDLLEVEQTLARVRGEIEQISGRMRYLENRVSLSTLTVQLEGPQPTPTTGGPVWTAKDIWRQAVRSLLETGRGLATMGIWIGVFAVVWVPVLLVLVWLVRRAFPQAGEGKTEGK